MSFKAWCLQNYGITGFSSGQISDTYFIPLINEKSATVLAPLLKYYGAYQVNSANKKGIMISKENYSYLVQHLRHNYSQQSPHPVNEQLFQQWLTQYFSSLNLNLQSYEYKPISKMHLTFQSAGHASNLFNVFREHFPRHSFDPITNSTSIEMPAGFLTHLMHTYEQTPDASIPDISNIPLLIKQLHDLYEIKNTIYKYQLTTRLDNAHKLSMDLENTGLGVFDASSAYALSLQTYAALNTDKLSNDQYQGLMYASMLLATYDDKGNIRQSLKTDSNFVEYFRDIYLKEACKFNTTNGYPLISQLPPPSNHNIPKAIQHNINGLLYGNKATPLGKNKFYVMRRFLPDDNMYSETDEIVLQGGGMRNHSAMFRIIKVGIMANGQEAGINDTPHHYDYYRVENNLGAGCDSPDFNSNTCNGTYVTKLEPFQWMSNTLQPHKVDPFKDPKGYQQSMATTITQLLTAERQMMCYRQPMVGQNGEANSPPNSNEGKEWRRLNAIKTMLQGRPHFNPVRYYSTSPLDPTKRIACSVMTQKGYMQRKGSCPIFSLKSLVTSVIGRELTAFHTDFLQQNNAKGHLAAIDKEIDVKMNQIQHALIVRSIDIQKVVKAEKALPVIKNYKPNDPGHNAIQPLESIDFIFSDQASFQTLMKQIPPSDIIYSGAQGINSWIVRVNPNWVAHFDMNQIQRPQPHQVGIFKRECPGLTLLKEKLKPFNIRNHKSIFDAVLVQDIKDPQKLVLKLKCSSASSALDLGQKLEQLTMTNPRITITKNNEIIIGQYRRDLLFNKLGIQVDATKVFPFETNSSKENAQNVKQF